jgi:hypothetical protein
MPKKKDRLTRFREWYSNHPVWSLVVIVCLVFLAVVSVLAGIVFIYDLLQRESESETVVDTRPTVANDDYVPQSFDVKDHRLLGIHRFQLRTQVGESVQLGKCPDEACLTLKIRSVDIMHEPAQVAFSMGLVSGGSRFDVGGVGFSMFLRKGCFRIVRTSVSDFYIELVDDRVEHITAVVGFFPGTQREGFVYGDTSGCP